MKRKSETKTIYATNRNGVMFIMDSDEKWDIYPLGGFKSFHEKRIFDQGYGIYLQAGTVLNKNMAYVIFEVLKIGYEIYPVVNEINSSSGPILLIMELLKLGADSAKIHLELLAEYSGIKIEDSGEQK